MEFCLFESIYLFIFHYCDCWFFPLFLTFSPHPSLFWFYIPNKILIGCNGDSNSWIVIVVFLGKDFQIFH